MTLNLERTCNAWLPASAGLGIVALPAYVCWPEVEAGHLRQVLPGWIAANSSVTALIPYRRGLLPAVRALVDFLAVEFPQAVATWIARLELRRSPRSSILVCLWARGDEFHRRKVLRRG